MRRAGSGGHLISEPTERRESMGGTFPDGLARDDPTRAVRAEPEAAQPMADRRRTKATLGGDLSDREPALDERSEMGFVDPASRGVDTDIPRPEAVLAGPVGHG
jgi:hypothetical protein